MPKLSLGYSRIVLSSIKSNDSKLNIGISSKLNSVNFYGLLIVMRKIRIINIIENIRTMADKMSSNLILFFLYDIGLFLFLKK